MEIKLEIVGVNGQFKLDGNETLSIGEIFSFDVYENENYMDKDFVRGYWLEVCDIYNGNDCRIIKAKEIEVPWQKH